MDAEMDFTGPVEDAPDYLLTTGERWDCPCGGGFWQRVNSMSKYLSSWVWCPHCGASAAWMPPVEDGSEASR